VIQFVSVFFATARRSVPSALTQNNTPGLLLDVEEGSICSIWGEI